MYNQKFWKLTDTTRKLYHTDKTTTPNADIIDYSFNKMYYVPKQTCISRNDDLRIENLARIKKLKEKNESYKLWKF